MATLTSTEERKGALEFSRFTALNQGESPEVRATNEWLRHVGKSIMGYATWVPSNKVRAENAIQFESQAGHQRILSPFCSAPIYFARDWDLLKDMQEVRMSEKPLAHAKLQREFELGIKEYGDLLGLAREYSLLKGDETASTQRLKELILKTEFQE